MRMEELAESQYLKTTDQVEKYLLNLIRLYFAHSNTAQPESREYIIQRAVERMKEEITFDNMGVFSITLPSGEVRVGAVTLTLEDLGGEPLISPKKSAFNVPFGNEQNTACEGNDPRLSDAREPLPHTHAISEVNGLEGQLSTLEGLLNRGLRMSHTHDNKNVLDMLTYSGTKTVIDLADLEKIQEEIERIINEIYDELVRHKQEIQDKIAEISTKIDEVRQKVDDLKDYILQQNRQWYDEAKRYTDDKVADAENTINAELANYIKKEQVEPIVEIANKAYILAGQVVTNFDDIVPHTPKDVTSSSDVYQNMLLNNELSNAIIECKIRADGVTYMMPYIIMNDGIPTGTITYRRTAAHSVEIICDADVIPDEVTGAEIEISYLKTDTVTI